LLVPVPDVVFVPPCLPACLPACLLLSADVPGSLQGRVIDPHPAVVTALTAQTTPFPMVHTAASECHYQLPSCTVSFHDSQQCQLALCLAALISGRRVGMSNL